MRSLIRYMGKNPIEAIIIGLLGVSVSALTLRKVFDEQYTQWNDARLGRNYAQEQQISYEELQEFQSKTEDAKELIESGLTLEQYNLLITELTEREITHSLFNCGCAITDRDTLLSSEILKTKEYGIPFKEWLDCKNADLTFEDSRKWRDALEIKLGDFATSSQIYWNAVNDFDLTTNQMPEIKTWMKEGFTFDYSAKGVAQGWGLQQVKEWFDATGRFVQDGEIEEWQKFGVTPSEYKKALDEGFTSKEIYKSARSQELEKILFE